VRPMRREPVPPEVAARVLSSRSMRLNGAERRAPRPANRDTCPRPAADQHAPRALAAVRRPQVISVGTLKLVTFDSFLKS
jgi:hypothetical protein